MTNFSSITVFTFALWRCLQCGGPHVHVHTAHWIIRPCNTWLYGAYCTWFCYFIVSLLL